MSNERTRTEPNTVQEDRIVEFDRLNTAGKAVFIAGTAFKTLGMIVDFTVGTIGDVWTLAENAFNDGLSEDIDEATVLEDED